MNNFNQDWNTDGRPDEENHQRTRYQDDFDWDRKPRRSAAVVVFYGIIITVAIAVGASIFTFSNYSFPSNSADMPVGGSSMELPNNIEDFMEEYFTESDDKSYLPLTEANAALTMELSDLGETELSFQEIYAKCSDSIVGISTMQNGVDYGWGTGIIFSSDGYIITNAHVIAAADYATITLADDREFEASLVGYDNISDLAVIKIDCTGLTAASFANSDALSVGDAVVAIGNPLGEDFRGTMTDGIISAINRDINMDGYSMTVLQTNAAINGGNSGGALIDMYGNVVGITNMKMTSYYDTIEGIGFAIPTSIAQPIINEIMANGAVLGRASIGITVGAVSVQMQEEYDVPAGVYVSVVSANSGAEAVGILVGDIVTHADGIEIIDSDGLLEVKSDKAVGDTIVLDVWRDGELLSFDVVLVDSNVIAN